MAQVDFSNARIEIYTASNKPNPTQSMYVNLQTGVLNNSEGVRIVNNYSVSVQTSEAKQLILLYQGTFTASGTEFYISAGSSAPWKVSNISFNSGDTYVFQINATLTCN